MLGSAQSTLRWGNERWYPVIERTVFKYLDSCCALRSSQKSDRHSPGFVLVPWPAPFRTLGPSRARQHVCPCGSPKITRADRPNNLGRSRARPSDYTEGDVHYPTRPVDRDKAEAELLLNIKKATSPEETAPKQKHVRSPYCAQL